MRTGRRTASGPRSPRALRTSSSRGSTRPSGASPRRTHSAVSLRRWRTPRFRKARTSSRHCGRSSRISTGPMSRRVPFLPWVLSALTFFVSFFLGALAVDPLPVYRAVQEKRLFLSGARREVFAADDGTSLSAFVLGPLSAERPVVLLHGLGADATYWRRAARFPAPPRGPPSAEGPVAPLPGLGAAAPSGRGAARFLARHGRTVILPDAPGSGHSEPPRDPAGFGLPGRVAATDALPRALAR